MSAHPYPLVGFSALGAGPYLVARAKLAEGPLRNNARCAPQRMSATGRAGLARRHSGFRKRFLQGGDARFESIEPRGLGLEGFPERKLIEEFDDV